MLFRSVQDDPPDPGVKGLVQFTRGLVVAVENEAPRREIRHPCDVKFPARRDVKVETLLVDQPGHRRGEECLPGVGNGHVRVARPKGRPVGAAAVPDVGFVEDVKRRLEVPCQGDGVAPANLEVTSVVDSLGSNKKHVPEYSDGFGVQ